MPLITEPHLHTPGQQTIHAFSAGDDFYEALMDAHRGLSDEDSERLNARLLLLLSNHIGDMQVLREALQIAARGLERRPVAPVTA